MMTSRQFYVALAVLAMSALAGGLLGDWLLPGRTAWAQAESRPLEPPPTQAASAAKEVRAERFILVDGTGQKRAILAVLSGDPILSLMDAAGQPRVILTVMGGDPRLWLDDGAGHMRVRLGLIDGEPGLWLADAAGQNRVVLGSVKTEDTRTGAIIKYPISTISLFTETGRGLWQAP